MWFGTIRFKVIILLCLIDYRFQSCTCIVLHLESTCTLVFCTLHVNVQRIERTRKQKGIEFTARNLGEFQLDVRNDRDP